ncbi:hypothetical protein GGR56DRAFT_234980 [Xylariaceae sp. FL0804]|nr:hypothetical protein GGR56DRAFT_234980 [Xylariaceae sp. FL0804]
MLAKSGRRTYNLPPHPLLHNAPFPAARSLSFLPRTAFARQLTFTSLSRGRHNLKVCGRWWWLIRPAVVRPWTYYCTIRLLLASSCLFASIFCWVLKRQGILDRRTSRPACRSGNYACSKTPAGCRQGLGLMEKGGPDRPSMTASHSTNFHTSATRDFNS